MKRALAWLTVLLPVASALAACGGAGDDSAETTAGQTAGRAGSNQGGHAGGGSGGGAQGGSAGAAGFAPKPISPRGSLDLLMGTPKQSFPMGTGNVKSPSAGAAFRIDIPEPDPMTSNKSGKGSGPGWKALVTPRWGTPALFDVTQGEGVLTLTGSATVKSGGVTDVWQSFVIALDAGGMATGAVSGVGQESVLLDGVGVSGKVSVGATLTPDATAPEAKPALANGFAGTSLLPWEPVVTRFSEPVAQADAAAHLSVSSDGEPLATAWTYAPDLGGDLGIVTASGVRLSWDAAASEIVTLKAGFRDFASNAGGGFEQSFDVLAIPPASSVPLALAKNGAAFTTWGSPKLDAPCDGGACVALGPVSLASCGVSVTGLAGRVSDSSAKVLRIRFRALFAETLEMPGAPPYLGGVPVVTASAARPGAAPVNLEVSAPETMDLGSQAGQFHYATPWTYAELPLPTGQGEIGWALRAGGHTSSAACDGKTMSVPMVVLVETVSTL